MADDLLSNFRAGYEHSAAAFNEGDLDRALAGPAGRPRVARRQRGPRAIGAAGPGRDQGLLSGLPQRLRPLARSSRSPSSSSPRRRSSSTTSSAGPAEGPGCPSRSRPGSSGSFEELRPVRVRQFFSREEALAAAGGLSLAGGRRADGGGRLLRGGDRSARRRDRRGRAPQPLLQRPGAGRPPDLARGALPAPALGVRRRGPGGRLRRRGDGPLRLRRRLRRRHRGAGLGADPRPAPARPPARRSALRRALDRRPRLLAEGPRHRRPPGRRRLRRPLPNRHPDAGALPDPLRGSIAAAADSRSGRRGACRPQALLGWQ